MVKPPRRMEPEAVDLSKAGRAAGNAFQQDSFANYMARKIGLQRQQFGLVLPPRPEEEVSRLCTVVDEPAVKKKREAKRSSGLSRVVKRLKRRHGRLNRKSNARESSETKEETPGNTDYPAHEGALCSEASEAEPECQELIICQPRSPLNSVKREQSPAVSVIKRPDLFFRGIVVLVNGYTNPDTDTLQRLLHKHGGDLERYETSRITHIIAEHLSKAKASIYKKQQRPTPVVHPAWITDSVRQQKVLPWANYLIDEVRDDHLSPSVASYFRIAGAPRQTSGGDTAQTLVPSSLKRKREETAAKPQSPQVCDGWTRTNEGQQPKDQQSPPAVVNCSPRRKVTFYLATKRQRRPLNDDIEKVDAQSEEEPDPSTEKTHVGNLLTNSAYDKSELVEKQPKLQNSKPNRGMQVKESPGVSVQQPTCTAPDIVSPEKGVQRVQKGSDVVISSLHRENCEKAEPSRRIGPDAFDLMKAGDENADIQASQDHLEIRNSPVAVAGEPTQKASSKFKGCVRTVGTDSEFLDSFFAASRLSFIGSYKQRTKMSPTRKVFRDDKSHRLVFHIDMDCFFAAVVLRKYPEYRDKPVVISHHGQSSAGGPPIAIATNSTSECATCNYHARKFGIKKGMYLGRARQLCPSLVVLQYDFDGYEEVSEQVEHILSHFAEKYNGIVEQVSCDEAFLELSFDANEDVRNKAYEVAESIRTEILDSTRCSATVGVASNKFLAKLAGDHVKPNKSFVVEDYRALLCDLKLRDLHGIGYRLDRKLAENGLVSVRDVWDLGDEGESELQKVLGPGVGRKIHQFCYGIDKRPVEPAERKTIGAEVRASLVNLSVHRLCTRSQYAVYSATMVFDSTDRTVSTTW